MTREEAKELLTHMMMSYVPKDQYGDYDDPEPYEQAIDMAIEALSERTGEWKTDKVYAGIGFYRCDQCDFRQSEKSRYCPNCGADMRGGGADGKTKTSV